MNTQPLKRMIGALVLVGVAGLALAGCSSASGTPSSSPAPSTSAPAKPSRKALPAGESRVAGTVSTVSSTQLVLTKKDGSSDTLTTDATTKIVGGPLAQGQRVTAVVKGQQAISVHVAKPKTSTSATPTTTPSS